MKKTICLFVLCAFVVLSSSCLPNHSRHADSSGKSADARTEQIINALKNEDRDAIKALFSETALSEIKDIDADIDFLFNYYDGEILSWDRRPLSSKGKRQNGKKSKILFYDIIINTENDSFSINMMDYNINTFSPEKEGVYMMELYKGEWDTEFSFDERLSAGIHEPRRERIIEEGESFSSILD